MHVPASIETLIPRTNVTYPIYHNFGKSKLEKIALASEEAQRNSSTRNYQRIALQNFVACKFSNELLPKLNKFYTEAPILMENFQRKGNGDFSVRNFPSSLLQSPHPFWHFDHQKLYDSFLSDERRAKINILHENLEIRSQRPQQITFKKNIEDIENSKEMKVNIGISDNENVFKQQKILYQNHSKMKKGTNKSVIENEGKIPQNRMKNIPGLIMQRIKTIIKKDLLFWQEISKLWNQVEKDEIKQLMKGFNKEDKTWLKITRYLGRAPEIGLNLIKIIVSFLDPKNSQFLEEWLETGRMNGKIKNILKNPTDIETIKNKFQNIEKVLQSQKKKNNCDEFNDDLSENEIYGTRSFKKIKIEENYF